jgi:hypothetical protein
MTGKKLLRQIVLQSKNQPYGKDCGWIVVRLPRVSERDLSLHIKEAGDRDLLKVAEVTSLDSRYDEWKVIDVTAAGLQFLEDIKPSRKLRLFLWAALLTGVALVGWLIPVLISLLKQ